MSLTDMLIISEKANTAKITWGENDFAYISPNSNLTTSKKISELIFPHGPRKYASDENELNDSIALYRKIEDFYNEISKIEGLTIITRTPTYHTLIPDLADVEREYERKNRF